MRKDSLALVIAIVGIVIMLVIIAIGLYFQYR